MSQRRKKDVKNSGLYKNCNSDKLKLVIKNLNLLKGGIYYGSFKKTHVNRFRDVSSYPRESKRNGG